MLMRNILISTAICATLIYGQPQQPRGGGGLGVQVLGARAGRPGRIVKGAPYSATVTNETTRTLPDGNTIHQISSEAVYRDSEGRTRREPSLSSLGSATQGGTVPQLAFIDDPVAGISNVLNLSSRTATRSIMPQPLIAGTRPNPVRRQRPDAPNTKIESLGTQIVSGVSAEGTRTTLTIPAGQIGNAQAIQVVSERWYSPELQLVVLQKRSDPRNGDTVYQLSNLSRAEPPSNLFAVPADFQVSDAPQRRARRQANNPQQ